MLFTFLALPVCCYSQCHPQCTCGTLSGTLSCSQLEHQDILEMRLSGEYDWVREIILDDCNELDMTNIALFPYLKTVIAGKSYSIESFMKGARHKKTNLKIFVIPKEGLASCGPANPSFCMTPTTEYNL